MLPLGSQVSRGSQTLLCSTEARSPFQKLGPGFGEACPNKAGNKAEESLRLAVLAPSLSVRLASWSS